MGFLFHVISWFNILTLPRIICAVLHSVSRLSLSGSHQAAAGAESFWSSHLEDFSEFCSAAFPHNDFNGCAGAPPEESHHTQSLLIQIFTNLEEWAQRYNCPCSMDANVTKESAHALHLFLESYSSYSLLGMLNHPEMGGIGSSFPKQVPCTNPGGRKDSREREQKEREATIPTK